MKTRNDCEIACDCVKRANVVLHVGLCKESFARKHTATHKPTSAQPLIVTTMRHIHTHIHLTRELVAVEPRRPPVTDVGTELFSDSTSASISKKVNIFEVRGQLMRSTQYRSSPASIYMYIDL